jgi:uncharacterized protein
VEVFEIEMRLIAAAIIVLIGFIGSNPTAASKAMDLIQGRHFSKVTSMKLDEAMRLAESGDAIAQYRVGYIYYIGREVPKDLRKAVKWWRKAANGGWLLAQKAMGNSYENGFGVTENLTKAIKWYGMAAKQGDADAQYELGTLYRKIAAVSMDENNDRDKATLEMKEALRWLHKSAEQGYQLSHSLLAFIYGHGHEASQDMVQAHKWASLAGLRSSNLGIDVREALETVMTCPQIKEAQHLALAWMSKKQIDTTPKDWWLRKWRLWRGCSEFRVTGIV